jgi:hypothetical protein
MHQHHQQQLGVHPALPVMPQPSHSHRPSSSAGTISRLEAVELARHQQQPLALGVAVGRHHGQVHEDARQVEQAREPARDEDDVEGLDPEIRTAHARRDYGGTQKKRPRHEPGPASLIAVITLRHLLREEKQGATASRLSSKNDFSRTNICAVTGLNYPAAR